jgi:hypothetical protein
VGAWLIEAYPQEPESDCGKREACVSGCGSNSPFIAALCRRLSWLLPCKMPCLEAGDGWKASAQHALEVSNFGKSMSP